MTKISSVAACAAILLVVTGRASAEVRTATAPDAHLTALRTFDLMKQPAGAPEHGSPDRALRTDLVKGFEDLGYVRSQNPDFLVAYYSAGKDALDVTRWDYGYPFHPRWLGPGRDWGAETEFATHYPKGTVLVDVVDPRTEEVLWRGQGVANLSGNEQQYQQDLWNTLTSILQKFPTASGKMTSFGAAQRLSR